MTREDLEHFGEDHCRFEVDATGAHRCLTDAELREKLRAQIRFHPTGTVEHLDATLQALKPSLTGVKSATLEEGRLVINVDLRHRWYRWPWRWRNHRLVGEELRPLISCGVLLVVR